MYGKVFGGPVSGLCPTMGTNDQSRQPYIIHAIKSVFKIFSCKPHFEKGEEHC